MERLNPLIIPKFKNNLEKIPVFIPSLFKREDKINYHYNVDACEFYQQILPEGFKETKVWGFGGTCKDYKNKEIRYIKHSPGPTFEVERGVNTNIQWNNKLLGEYMFNIDPSLNWSNPNSLKFYKGDFDDIRECQWPPTLVVHLHGIVCSSQYDGNPRSWYTATGIKGPLYSTNYYKYSNEQFSATLWYYEQSLGVSRISVYSGLCGLYIIKDENTDLPKDDYYMPLIIQDKSFNEDASLYYPDNKKSGLHPYWENKFFGDTIVVNGKVWPNLNVENQLYRFSIVNGSNCRPYKIALSDDCKIVQIGSDGGLLEEPQELMYFVLYPGERVEILIDFSRYKKNDTIIMKNLFGSDQCEDILQFTVKYENKIKKYNIQDKLIPHPNIKINAKKIYTVLDKHIENNCVQGYHINNERYFNPPRLITKVGEAFIWEFINLSDEDICIHLHLAQFKVLERQKINEDLIDIICNEDLVKINENIYDEEPILSEKYEKGFKDTLYCPPKFSTRIIVRYSPSHIMNDIKVGENYYSFNPSEGPQYILSSQILEQKDNLLLRPQIILYEKQK